MHMVELGPLKDSLVGQPGLSGLALEARKVSPSLQAVLPVLLDASGLALEARKVDR